MLRPVLLLASLGLGSALQECVPGVSLSIDACGQSAGYTETGGSLDPSATAPPDWTCTNVEDLKNGDIVPMKIVLVNTFFTDDMNDKDVSARMVQGKSIKLTFPNGLTTVDIDQDKRVYTPANSPFEGKIEVTVEATEVTMLFDADNIVISPGASEVIAIIYAIATTNVLPHAFTIGVEPNNCELVGSANVCDNFIESVDCSNNPGAKASSSITGRFTAPSPPPSPRSPLSEEGEEGDEGEGGGGSDDDLDDDDGDDDDDDVSQLTEYSSGVTRL